MPKPFQRIREAAIDGRTQNVYYRQSQLERLRNVLVQNEEALQQAIVDDSGNSVTEAKIEYGLALLALKDQYASLNPAAALEEEYAITHGKDAPQRTEGAGIVYIVPTAHTLLYSIIAPLCAAIAAGNCVIVEVCALSNSSSMLDPFSLTLASKSSSKQPVKSLACSAGFWLRHLTSTHLILPRAEQQTRNSARNVSRFFKKVRKTCPSLHS